MWQVVWFGAMPKYLPSLRKKVWMIAMPNFEI
jgi:hypothetical protein